MVKHQHGSAKIAILALLICAVTGVLVATRSAVLHRLQNGTAKPVPAAQKPQPASHAAVNRCAGNAVGKLLLVSIKRQHLWACNGTMLAKDSPVTTGTTVITNGVNDATPTGTWHIYSKQTNRHLTGCDANGCWNDYVQYWMPFDESVGFHDASWQTFPFGAGNYHTDGSHACVHLPTAMAAWVYNWAPVGTTVTVAS